MNSPSLNPVNCWETLRARDATTQLVTTDVNAEKSLDWVISNQAILKEVEGSTIRDGIRLGEISTSAGVFPCMFVCMPLFMEIGMFCNTLEELKVLNSIVLKIPVDMMDYFFGRQISTKLLFHNKSMLHDISPSVFIWMIRTWNHNIGGMGSCDKATMEGIYDFDSKFSCYRKNSSFAFSKCFCNLGSTHSYVSKNPNIIFACSTISWFNWNIKNTHILKDVFFTNPVFFSDFDTGLEDIIILLQFFRGEWNFYISSPLHEFHYITRTIQRQGDIRYNLNLSERIRG